MEVWQPIPGFEGAYEASSNGQVRSLSRVACNGRTVPAKILTPSCRGGRYLYVMLGKDGQRFYFGVHQIVLMTFVGRCPEGMQGCHFNGNMSDNRIENLRWDTSKANHADRRRHGRITVTRGEGHYASKLTEDNVRSIRRLVHEGAIQRRVAEKFGIHPTTVCEIVKREKWAHVV